jgi:hypothetical protein
MPVNPEKRYVFSLSDDARSKLLTLREAAINDHVVYQSAAKFIVPLPRSLVAQSIENMVGVSHQTGFDTPRGLDEQQANTFLPALLAMLTVDKRIPSTYPDPRKLPNLMKAIQYAIMIVGGTSKDPAFAKPFSVYMTERYGGLVQEIKQQIAEMHLDLSKGEKTFWEPTRERAL